MFRSASTRLAHSSSIAALAGSKDLKLLQDVISAEKTVLISLQKLSVDFGKAAEALGLWGFGEGKDLRDILAASTNLLSQFSTAISNYASHEDTIRNHMKSVRSREEALHDLKKRRKALISKADAAEKKLSKTSRGHKNYGSQMDALDSLRKDIGVMDSEIMSDEASLGDLKRSKTKAWMGLKFGGLLECCEKGTIIGKFGQLIVAEIPEKYTQPGMLRSLDINSQRVNSLLGDATRCVGEVVFSAVGDSSTYPPRYVASPQRMGTGHFMNPSEIQRSPPVSPVTASTEQFHIPDKFGMGSTITIPEEQSYIPDDFGTGSTITIPYEQFHIPGDFGTGSTITIPEEHSYIPDNFGTGSTITITEEQSYAPDGFGTGSTITIPYEHSYTPDDFGTGSTITIPYEQFYTPDDFGTGSTITIPEEQSHTPDGFGTGSTITIPEEQSHIPGDFVTGYFLQDHQSASSLDREGYDSRSSIAATLDARNSTVGSAPSYGTYRDHLRGSPSGAGTPPVLPSPWERQSSPDSNSNFDNQRISTYSHGEATGYFLRDRHPSSLDQDIGEGDDFVLPSFVGALDARRTIEVSAPTYTYEDYPLGSPSGSAATPPLSPGTWESLASLDPDSFSNNRRISTYDDDVADMFDPLALLAILDDSDIPPELYWGHSVQGQEDCLAALAQLEQDKEDLRRAEEASDLEAAKQPTFTCGVCMELTLNTDLAMVEYCEHKFCRECFLQYLLSKIRDRRFPIACPTCMSDKSHADPSIIEYSLIEQMNIPEKDFQILEELMLSSHGTPVHCIRCSRTTLMDREEYQECTVVTCPLPDCVHSWCKKCSQTIDTDVPGTPKHSCDGTNEFESLMREKGWKACPGCNTNFQKIEGCNHMTCLSPGCNMHFCYRCGQAIVQSVIGREIDDAMREHYGSCQLFEVEDDLD